MRFGPVSIDDAEGAILAHSQQAGSVRLRKGVVLTEGAVAALAKAGVRSVVAARLEDGDVTEDAAATRIAKPLVSDGIEDREASTGRVNLHATHAGVFRVDKVLVDAINAVDPSITVATLADNASVGAGQMVATIKIIPFAVSGSLIDRVSDRIRDGRVFAVHSYRRRKVGLIQSELPTVKESVLGKTRRITEMRLTRSSSKIVEELRTRHRVDEVASAIAGLLGEADMIIVFGASAMSDEDDVIPAAIRNCGGCVERVGMPVDPGNLLVLGWVGKTPVVGAPGCARSPKENGFDWVLDRLMADIPVGGQDIAGMGVGGLLMEIASRPQPREKAGQSDQITVHASVLAAGRSSRMEGPNKLLALFGGVPLVRRTVLRTLQSRASGVSVISGHQNEEVGKAISGLDVNIANNPDYATGLSSSLRTAVLHTPEEADGLMVVLGDMPGITTVDLDELIKAFERSGGGSIVRATHNGKRGNPVVLPRAVFPEVLRLEGDTGARHLVERSDVAAVDVEIGAAASLDVDTRDALERAGGVLPGI